MIHESKHVRTSLEHHTTLNRPSSSYWGGKEEDKVCFIC